jgi:hypothetical protein
MNSQLADDARESSAHIFAQLVTLCTLDSGNTTSGNTSSVHWTNAYIRALHDAGVVLPRLLSAPASLPPLPLDSIGLRTHVQLRSYQVEGVTWLSMLYRFNLHGILADDMGLGKTLQTLCILAHAHIKAHGHVSGVCPMDTLYSSRMCAGAFANRLSSYGRVALVR